jgi:hypothetical protein
MDKIQETIYKYKTVDGKVFDTEEEAKKHELELTANVAIQLPNGKVLCKGEIKEFFRQSKCEHCPFMVECQSMKDEIRKHTTNTFGLCDVIVYSEHWS